MKDRYEMVCDLADGWREKYEDAKQQLIKTQQQLAEREKQIVMLRRLVEYAAKEGDTYTFDTDVFTEALSYTKDLSGLILCDAEPVGYVTSDGFYAGYNKDDAVGTYIYKARKP